MNIKIKVESGGKVEMTDKPIINVMGNVVQNNIVPPETYKQAEASDGQPRKTKVNPKTRSVRKTSSRSKKPMTLKYFTHGNNGVLMKQRKRVDLVFNKWNEWGWIDEQTSPDDFDAFFEGEPRHCNISWTANSTILTILLQELLKQPYIEKQTGCAAKSLVELQFGKTANSDRTRLDNDAEDRIKLTLLILNINNPLPEPHGRNVSEEFDIQDAALKEIFAGQLRSTKGI